MSGVLPGAIIRKLEALGYPDVENVKLRSPGFERVVLWLEESKVRFWNQNERVKLRETNSGAKWMKCAKEYLTQLGLPESKIEKLHDRSEVMRLDILDTLLSMAVHDEYQDAVEEGRVDVPMHVPDEQDTSTKGASLDLVPLLDPLNEILSQNGLPYLTADVNDDDIAAAVGILHSRIMPSRADRGTNSGEVDLDTIPIGVSLPKDVSSSYRRAVGILRFLHNSNMREFQAQINDVINNLQQYTADPRTDAALGRVGM